LEKTLEETKMIGKMVSSNEFVDIFEPPEGMMGNLHIVKRPHTGNILKIKLEKARAWINTRNAGIEGEVGLIIYTDEDIVIGKDLTNFVKEAKSYVPNKHTLALFRDTGKSKGELHTGVVVIYNYPHAERCLQEWGQTLTGLDIYGTDSPVAKLADMDALEKEVAITDGTDADKEEEIGQDVDALTGPDQQALGRTKSCMAAPNHQGIRILPKEFFWFPTPGGMTAGKTAEFIHFTNTGRWVMFSKTDINKYLSGIGIPSHIDPLGHSHSEECLIAFDNTTKSA
jgi:hypothetical protein